MRFLLSLFILLLAGCYSNVEAATATFTWNKPVPAFSEPVPPSWQIDEYRIYCDLSGATTIPTYTATVTGYDTESLTATDLPVGVLTCRMTSYSVGAGTESIDSNTVTHTVYNNVSPGAPTIFNFIPLVQ